MFYDMNICNWSKSLHDARLEMLFMWNTLTYHVEGVALGNKRFSYIGLKCQHWKAFFLHENKVQNKLERLTQETLPAKSNIDR